MLYLGSLQYQTRGQIKFIELIAGGNPFPHN